MLALRRLLHTLLAIACTGLALGGAGALADPPARVARLAYVQGDVGFAPAGEDEWVVARVNRPVVTGDSLWTDAGARAELQIGSAALRLGAMTSATALNVDDRIAQFRIAQGAVSVSVPRLAPGQAVEIDTPNLALSITRPGVYRIDVDADGDFTAVGVRQGQAQVYGDGAAYAVSRGQWYRFYGTGLAQRRYAALPAPDAFDRWASDRDRRRAGGAAARYVSTEVIGYEDLDEYGTWTTVAEYGAVWTPTRVASDWAPYRDGQWSWIEPWGWTWVDAAPWGFAPYHYGRWAYVRERWCWVPGPRMARAVYAPALVAFVGDANFRLTIATGPTASVAWFPLAPGEVYRPPYAASRDYFTRVNVTNTQVTTTIVNNVYNNKVVNVTYRHRDAARGITAVPSTVLVQSAPVAKAALKVTPADLATAKVAAAAPVAPSRISVLGSERPARVKPSAQVLKREVVARTAPPPTPVALEAKDQPHARQPGRPPDSNAVANARQERPADAPKVKVVAAPRQPESAPKASQEARADKGQPSPASSPAAQPPTAVAPPDRKEAKKREDAGKQTESVQSVPPARSAQPAPPARSAQPKLQSEAPLAARPPEKRTTEPMSESARAKPDAGKPDKPKPDKAAPGERKLEARQDKARPDKGKPDVAKDEAKSDEARERHARRN